jgi:hypothetical protein
MSSRAPPAYGSKRRLCRFPTPDGQRFDPSQSRGTGRGPRVDYEILHDLKAEVTSRLESERVEVKREVELVVDGFRYVRHTDATGACPASFIAENGVSSPPIVSSCDTFSRTNYCTVNCTITYYADSCVAIATQAHLIGGVLVD